MELGETMADNLVAKGVTASASDGLTTLAGKILDIQTGGSCYHIEFSEASYTAIGGSATLEIYLQESYAPKSGATVTVTGSDGSVYTGITNSNGVASVTVSNVSTATTFTATYSNVSDTCTVTVQTIYFYDDFTSGTLSDNWIPIGTNHTESINSNNQLVLKRTGDGRGGIYYNQQITGDYKVTIDLASATYDTYAIGLNLGSSAWTYYEVQPKWSTSYKSVNNSTSIETTYNEKRTTGVSYTSAIIVIEVIQDSNIKLYVNDSLKQTYTIRNASTDGFVGIVQCCDRTTTINSIKAEPIQIGSAFPFPLHIEP